MIAKSCGGGSDGVLRVCDLEKGSGSLGKFNVGIELSFRVGKLKMVSVDSPENFGWKILPEDPFCPSSSLESSIRVHRTQTNLGPTGIEL